MRPPSTPARSFNEAGALTPRKAAETSTDGTATASASMRPGR